MRKFLNYHRAVLFIYFLCSLLIIRTRAQPISFHHLNTSNGLSDNLIRSLAIDHDGYLWIGTVNGLNLYDGYGITMYNKEGYPQMASNDVIHLTCDKNNQLWLGTPEGISRIDENRKIHRVILEDSISKFSSRTIIETKAFGNILFTNLGQYYFDKSIANWKKLNWIPGELGFRGFMDAEPFDENKIIFTTDSAVLILDYESKQIVFKYQVSKAVSTCRLNENQIAIGIHSGIIQIIDIRSNRMIRQFDLLKETNRTSKTYLTEVRRAANGDLLIASGFAGLIIIDSLGNISHHTHDPVNPRSLAANNIFRVLAGNNGEVILGTYTSGVSIFNILSRQAGLSRI